MTISIKLSERGKKLLDIIQAEMTLKLGEKVSQQELLELVLEEAECRKDALIKRISRRPHVPLSKEGLKRLMGMPRDWGVATSEEEINKYLYGRPEF